MKRRRFITVLAGAALSAPLSARADAAKDIERWTGIALGADCSIAIAGKPPRQARQAIKAAVGEIRRMEALFSLYRADSELMRLNHDGRLDAPSPDMLWLLGLCDVVHRLTAGKFDPTVQPLWRLLAETGGNPDADALHAARALVGWQFVQRQGPAVAFARPGMALTLNGIAQGYATDRVTDVLAAHGVGNVLVDIGEIAARGEKIPGRPWRIGIAESGNDAPEQQIALRDRAIATSAPHGTVLDDDGAVSHILDRDEPAVRPRWRRISVIHHSAALADGLSTGFCLLDKDRIDAATAQAGADIICA